jgi:hypothetical protein
LCLENKDAKTSRSNDNNHDNNINSLHRYLESITRIRLIILAQSRSIWFVLPRWCYRTFSSLYRSEETTMQPIRRLARQACQAAAPGSPLDVLQHLPLYRDSPIKALDDAITLLFAGQVTSAATLSWTLYLLRAPTCAAKAGRKAATMLLIFLQHQRYPQETVAATQHGVLGRGRQGIYATVPGRSIRAPPT